MSSLAEEASEVEHSDCSQTADAESAARPAAAESMENSAPSPGEAEKAAPRPGRWGPADREVGSRGSSAIPSDPVADAVTLRSDLYRMRCSYSACAEPSANPAATAGMSHFCPAKDSPVSLLRDAIQLSSQSAASSTMR